MKIPADDIRIEHLAERIAVIPTLALWEQQEWGHLLPDTTFEMLILHFEQKSIPHQISQTFVAVAGEKPVGMASLDPHDLETRPELSPWLASVYVAPEFRNRGVGSRLVRTVMAEAEALGLEKLFVFTPNKVEFYRSLGWQILESTRYRGEEVVIMQYTIRSTHQGDNFDDQT